MDRDPALVEIDREEMVGSNVTMLCGDIESAHLSGPFDAIVGRFILRELKDAADTLRKLAALLVPDGVVAFQEKVLAMPIRTFPPLPLVDKVCSWMDQARQQSGVDVATGTKLAPIFVAAGLPSPTLRFDAPLEYGSGLGYAHLVETLRRMLPLVQVLGIAQEEDIEIDTLEVRMSEEAAAKSATVILTPCIGAWARIIANRDRQAARKIM
jgi:hypothetical protein